MSRFVVGIRGIAAVFALLATLGLATAASAAPLDTEAAMSERSIGAPDAPVTIREYYSLSCPHCATFHDEIWPRIKEAYVDTGKVRLVANDFPLGAAAMDAHMLARCAPKDRYFGLVGAYFDTMNQWRMSAEPRADLIRIAQLAGMSRGDAQACLANTSLRAAMEAVKQDAHERLGINGTPAFIIGDVKIPGVLPFEDFSDILDDAIAEAEEKR